MARTQFEQTDRVIPIYPPNFVCGSIIMLQTIAVHNHNTHRMRHGLDPRLYLQGQSAFMIQNLVWGCFWIMLYAFLVNDPWVSLHTCQVAGLPRGENLPPSLLSRGEIY